MNSSLTTLFFTEHRRIFTPIMSVILFGLTLIGWGYIFLPLLFSEFIPNSTAFWRVLYGAHDFIVSAALFLLAVGIVSNDLKEGWLSTLFIRPITREKFLLIKLSATLAVVLELFLIACVIPTTLFFLLTEMVNTTPLWDIVGTYLAMMFNIIQVALIYTFLSCYVPGMYNVILVAVWSVAESLCTQYVSQKFPDIKILNILTPYIYPNSWSEVAQFSLNGIFNYQSLLWGCCTLALFTMLAFRSFNNIQIEAGGE